PRSSRTPGADPRRSRVPTSPRTRQPRSPRPGRLRVISRYGPPVEADGAFVAGGPVCGSDGFGVGLDQPPANLQGAGPHVIEILSHRSEPFGPRPVQPAGAGAALGDQPGLLEHRQVL